MKKPQASRREFLQQSAAAASALAAYQFLGPDVAAQDAQSPNNRPRIGCIGTGDRWNSVGPAAGRHGDILAVCDVDRNHVERAKARFQGRPEMYEDYRRVLDRNDIDVVTIVTPDHWHSKIAIEAMKAGKDVYCEKPLTLTIEEGKQIIRVLRETNRVFQVGTQQRSEMDNRFLTAVAICHAGRLGTIRKVTCAIGGAPTSPSLPVVAVPQGLNWEKWLGQAPLVDYVSSPVPANGGRPQSRCHYEFRWWYEFSGGKMTDWGAHHVDIAQWAIQADTTGPLSIEGTARHPNVPNGYNCATTFNVLARFQNGVELTICDRTPEFDNGILIEGDQGRLFVNRGRLTGAPVEALAQNPLPADLLTQLCKGKRPGSHMGNFFECVRDRGQTISDVFTHHRAMTTCHLANIAIRLGRRINWDPATEQIQNDEEARAMQSREQRRGYEITV